MASPRINAASQAQFPRWTCPSSRGLAVTDFSAYDEIKRRHGAERGHSAEPQPQPTIAPDAFCGLAGDFVRAVEPHTESDPIALLLQYLICCGKLSGAALTIS